MPAVCRVGRVLLWRQVPLQPRAARLQVRRASRAAGSTQPGRRPAPPRPLTCPPPLTCSDLTDGGSGGAGAAKPLPVRFGTLVERYYEQLFAVDVGGKPSHDQYVYRHANELLVVGVAPSHPLLAPGRVVASVTFSDALLGIEVSGKKKHGAPFVEEAAKLCSVVCTDGAVYDLVAAARGFVIEINERLLADPSLLARKVRVCGCAAASASPSCPTTARSPPKSARPPAPARPAPLARRRCPHHCTQHATDGFLAILKQRDGDVKTPLSRSRLLSQEAYRALRSPAQPSPS